MVDETWVPMSVAAKRVGVSQSKISRMAKQRKISTRKDPRDDRVLLVSMEELNRIFPPQ
jgi:hypothetical protein